MTDIKEYLPYCIGRKATIKTWQHRFVTKILSVHENGLVTVAHCYQNKDAWDAEYIIPHLRKLESLTEDEAEIFVKMKYATIQIDISIVSISKSHIQHQYRSTELSGGWRDNRVFFDSMNRKQFHYLNTIGIAWWATTEMWEKGMIIEVK